MAFVGVTHQGGGSGNAVTTLATSLPAGWLPGHVAMLYVEGVNATAGNYGIASGWTKLDEALATGTTGEAQVWVRVLVAGDTGPSVTATVGTRYGVTIAVESGVPTPTGTPVTHSTVASASAGTTLTQPTTTPNATDATYTFWGFRGTNSVGTAITVTPPSAPWATLGSGWATTSTTATNATGQLSRMVGAVDTSTATGSESGAWETLKLSWLQTRPTFPGSVRLQAVNRTAVF